MLHRYAEAKGVDVSVGEDTNILSCQDFAQVSECAIPAYQWVCGVGIITGKENDNLNPLGNATRAEAAVVLMRYQISCGTQRDTAK